MARLTLGRTDARRCPALNPGVRPVAAAAVACGSAAPAGIGTLSGREPTPPRRTSPPTTAARPQEVDVGRRRGLRRRRLWAVSTALAALVTVSPTTGGHASATPAAGSVYAALGDSYTSGPFIPIQEQPYGCLRSDHNYPNLVAAAIAARLTDLSCAGATTDDLTSSQGVTPGPANPPQLTALTTTTQIVTLGIGGNDIHFSTIAESCFSSTPTGHPCQDKYGNGGTSPDTIDQWIAAAAPKVDNALSLIHSTSPNAHVYLVGYPAIFPEQPLVAGAPE